jgi:hypothetical protein
LSTGSDRGWRDGHEMASTFPLVNIDPVVGGCAGGDVGEGAADRRSWSNFDSSGELTSHDRFTNGSSWIRLLRSIALAPTFSTAC